MIEPMPEAEIVRTPWTSARLTDRTSNSASTNPYRAGYYLQPS